MPLTPVPWRTAIAINSTTTDVQFDPAITQLANGNLVVSWTTQASTGLGAPAGRDILAQIVDPLGNLIGGEFRLNANSIDDEEQYARIAAMPDGGFVVVYDDRDLGDFTAGNIRLERYDAAGTRLPGNFIAVQDSGQTGYPNYLNPQVAVSSATSILVAYQRDDDSSFGGAGTILGKIFNPTTGTFGSELLLINTADKDEGPSVTVLKNGNYVIACSNDEGQIGESRIIYRILGPSGNNVLGSQEVAGTGDGDNLEDFWPNVTALEGGGFVLSWYRFDTSDDVDIVGRVFNAAGTQIGSFTAGNTGSNDQHYFPQTAALADGSFVVTFSDETDGQIRMAHFSATGAPLGNTVTYTDTDNLRLTATIGLQDGRFATAYVDVTGEISLDILDTRDEPNGSGVYAPGARIIGTTGDDFIFPIDGTDSVHGWRGNDTIVGLSGSRAYFGEDGNDTHNVLGGFDGSAHYGGSGIDTIDWSASTIGPLGAIFSLTGGRAERGVLSMTMTSFENLIGSSGTDAITGSPLGNVLSGEDGADLVYGEGGDDTVNGGTGADRLFGDTGFDTADFTGATGAVAVELWKADAVTRVVFTADGTGTFDEITDFEALIGGTGGDLLSGDFRNNAIQGAGGNDTLNGAFGDDYIDGGANEDYLFGAVGADTVLGGTGNDTIFGGDAGSSDGDRADLALGGDGADFLIGELGNDTLEGGFGNDYLIGGYFGLVVSGNDSMFGGDGIDTLLGEDGNDTLDGGNQNDYLVGGTGDDSMRGGDGADLIIGDGFGNEFGFDTLDGGLGNDTLLGGLGNDRYTGGGGNDQFWFRLTAGVSSGTKTITDYDLVNDVVVIDTPSPAALTFGTIQSLMSQTGANVTISFAGLGHPATSLVIENTLIAQLQANDFIVF